MRVRDLMTAPATVVAPGGSLHVAARASRLPRRPLVRLRAAIEEDVARHGDRLDVAVADRCGAVEVRVSGPSGNLRLLFDRAEAQPALVRHLVRRAIERYWA